MNTAILSLVAIIAAIQVEERVKRWTNQRNYNLYRERDRQATATQLRQRHGDHAAQSYLQQCKAEDETPRKTA